jgi:raffinose/stachyose/melibiose transport system permease protein
LFPLVWMFYSSFKTNQEFALSVVSLPKGFHFENYIHAWKTANIGIYFLTVYLFRRRRLCLPY